MAFQGTAFQPTAFQTGAGFTPGTPSQRRTKFENGQSQGHVANLVGFAGSALLWASAAALVLVPQPQLQAKEQTFGLHAPAIAQAGQSATFFKARVHYGAVVQTPAVKPWELAAPQESPELGQANFWSLRGFLPSVGEPQPGWSYEFIVWEQRLLDQPAPIFSGQTPLPAPAFRPWNVPPQESPEQTAPFWFGQQPLPSPAGKPIWTAWELQQGNESATIWGGRATLFIAQAQFDVPPKPFSAAPQESPEQTQPVVSGQQPLPTPPSRSIVTARDEDQPSESAAFWGSEATRFIAGTQFNLPPTDSRNVEQQRVEDQEQPQFKRYFFAPVADEVTVRQFIIGPQESPEQVGPLLFGQQPLPSPAGKSIWTAGEAQQGSQSATIWNANADLFIAATQFNVPPKPFAAAPQESTDQVQPLVWGSDATRFIAATQFDVRPLAFSARPQESPEQTQPLLFGQQPPAPVADEVTVRQFIAGPQESEEQSQPQFEQRFFAPVPIRSIAAGPQESLEQAQPWFARQYRVEADRPFLRPLQAAPEESQEQVQPAFSRAYFAPLVAPSFRPFTAAPQESTEQAQPHLFGLEPLPSPAFRSLAAGPQESLEQPSALIFKPYQLLAVVESPATRPQLFAAPQQDQEQAGPQFYRQLISDVELTSPAFRQWIAADQEDTQQPQPLVVHSPLPESQAPVVPPVVGGGGGDRDVILFREPRAKEPKVRKPKQANFAVRFVQSGQRFTALVASEVFVVVETESRARFEFDATVQVESSFAVRSSQQQTMSVRITATGQPQKFVPVKASFTAVRSRVEFSAGRNDMQVTIEVES